MKKKPKNIPTYYDFPGTPIFRDTTALPFLDGGPLVDKTNHGKLLNSVYASALGDYYANGGMLKRADGSYSPRGLWDNIRDNAGSGKKPTKQMLAQEKKINKEYRTGGQFPRPYSLPEDSFKQGGRNLHNSIYASSAAQYPAVYNFGGTLKNNLATRQQMYMPFDHITRTGGSILSMSNTPQLEGEGKDLAYDLGGNLPPFSKSSKSKTKSKNTNTSNKSYNELYEDPPIYLSDPNDPRIGQYTPNGRQFLYKEPTKVKPVQSKPEVGKLETKKLTQTPEIIPSNYNYTPQEPETIRTVSRSQTVMEPDPNRPGKFKYKELRQVPYSANFPEEGWLPMNAPQVMYYNPTTGEETEERFQDGGFIKTPKGIEQPIIDKAQDEAETFAYGKAADKERWKELMDNTRALMDTAQGRKLWYQDLKPKNFSIKELQRFTQGVKEYNQGAQDYERARRKVQEGKISTDDFGRMYDEKGWGKFDQATMKEGYQGQFQDAADEAQKRKEANMKYTDTALELITGAPALFRVAQDPLGTIAGVGNTIADVAMSANPGFSAAFGAGDPNVNPLTGNEYWSGLNKALDVVGFIPGAVGAGKGVKELLKQGNRLGLENVVKGKATIGDLFKRDDLVNFKTPEDLAAYEKAVAEGTLSPTRNRYYSSLESNPDALNYAKGSDQVFMHRIPQTKAAAAGKSLANLQPKGAALIAQQRSIPTIADVEDLISTGKLTGYSDETINGLREVAANPEGYWNLPIFKNNKELQSLIADPTIVNPAEHFLPRPAVGDFKLVGAGAIPLMANPKLIDIKPVVSAFESGYTNTNKAKLAVAPQTMSEEEAEIISRQDPNR